MIGTTLIAAAITNHPFLEGMKALTLYSCSAMGDLALSDTPGVSSERPVNLNDDGSQVGQHVTFNPTDEETTPELAPEERSQTFVITGVKRDEVFLKIATVDGGQAYGWYPQRAFVAADAPNKEQRSPMPPKTQPDVQLSAVSPEQQLINLSNTIHATEGLDLRAATIEAGKRLRTQAESYLEDSRQGDVPIPPTSQKAQFDHPRIDDSVVMPVLERLAAEHGLNLKSDLWKVLHLRTEGRDRAVLESYREAGIVHEHHRGRPRRSESERRPTADWP